ncbi:hypothetical protein GQX73_g424 [Xylaria multiplex]|uniref:Uncharacterized protein n=1 Tax=Xylaria multiplex TaxID=323545 RepID=A0A7C8N0T6_9PEZI|nr:hypothetical protein GQX73_g424 [Xylaria multiplex]
MFTKREKINASRSSLDSLCVEHHLERDGSDTESSHSETATPLIVKRSFQLYHQIIADIRQRPVSLKIWLPSTLFLAAVIIVVRILSPGFGYYNGCVVDGSFQIEYELSAIWAISDFFQVNIAAGNLTFTQAKVVDTTWDLVVGRGGQATLSLITWKVFADYAAVSMTIQPVTFATYRTLFTESGPSVSSTTRLFHDFIKYKRLSSKLASGFLIYSMLLSLALPTLSSAATGYVPLNEAFIRHDDDNLVPFSRFELTSYRPDLIWEYSNRTYHTGELESLGSCVPVKDVSLIEMHEMNKLT